MMATTYARARKQRIDALRRPPSDEGTSLLADAWRGCACRRCSGSAR